MSQQYTVGFVADSGEEDPQRAVLATLPNRFRIVASATADVLVMPGGKIDGAALQFIRPETRALFVTSAGALSAGLFSALLAAAGERPIGLGLAFASALSGEAEAQLRNDGADAPVIVDMSGEVSSVANTALHVAMFEQLMLLQSLCAGLLDLKILVSTEQQLVATARMQAPWRGIRLSVRRSFRNRLVFNTVSRSLRRELEITPDRHAQPPRIAILDAAGARTPPVEYQGGYRRGWLRLHEDLSAGRQRRDLLAAAERAFELSGR